MISVLIPTYNRAKFLPDTLSSVFAQTVCVDEVILIDDGSTDDTPAIVQSLLAQHSDWAARLQYIRQENHGKSVALNNGLRLARGEWLAFLDSDDTWLPEKLEMQFRALTEFPECRVCLTESSLGEFQRWPRLPESRARRERLRAGTQTTSAKGPFGKVIEPCWLYLVEWPGTYMQSAIVHRDVLRDWGEFDTRLRVEQDADFLFRLGLLTSFCYVALPLLTIHRDPNRVLGLSTNYPHRSLFRMSAGETRLKKWASIVDKSRPALRHAVKHCLASHYSKTANIHVALNNLSDARCA